MKKSIEDIKDEKVDELKKNLEQLKSKVGKFQKKVLSKYDKYVI